MKELPAPLRLAAHHDLRRFHQQEAQQRIALLGMCSSRRRFTAALVRDSKQSASHTESASHP